LFYPYPYEYTVQIISTSSVYAAKLQRSIPRTKLEENAKSEFEELEKEFKALIEERGRIIDQTIHIQHKENPDHHFLFEDADFSSATIKQQIKEGENDAEAALAEKKEQ
jgi:hypothetical protein